MYTDEQFLDFDYFSDAEGESNYNRKIVKTRKEQSCCGFYGENRHNITPGTRAICETVLIDGEGWRSNYLCLVCASRILESVKIYER